MFKSYDTVQYEKTKQKRQTQQKKKKKEKPPKKMDNGLDRVMKEGKEEKRKNGEQR